MNDQDTIHHTCARCKKRLRIPVALAGKRLRCPNKTCSAWLNIPEALDEEEQVPDRKPAPLAWVFLAAGAAVFLSVGVGLGFLVGMLATTGPFERKLEAAEQGKREAVANAEVLRKQLADQDENLKRASQQATKILQDIATKTRDNTDLKRRLDAEESRARQLAASLEAMQRRLAALPPDPPRPEGSPPGFPGVSSGNPGTPPRGTGSPKQPLSDPGTLSLYRQQTGQVYYFEVVGRNSGPVWGTDVYSDDSDLGTAAVHAGVLKLGEKGVVKVTLVGAQKQYRGSNRNGTTSQDFGKWEQSYRVAAGNTGSSPKR